MKILCYLIGSEQALCRQQKQWNHSLPHTSAAMHTRTLSVPVPHAGPMSYLIYMEPMFLPWLLLRVYENQVEGKQIRN